MDRDPSVKLGSLVTFAYLHQSGEYDIVIKLENDFAEVLWSSWRTIECSYASFAGDHWGNLKVIAHGN